MFSNWMDRAAKAVWLEMSIKPLATICLPVCLFSSHKAQTTISMTVAVKSTGESEASKGGFYF